MRGPAAHLESSPVPPWQPEQPEAGRLSDSESGPTAREWSAATVTVPYVAPARGLAPTKGRKAPVPASGAGPQAATVTARPALPRRAHVPMIGRAGHTRLGTRPPVGGGRCQD